MADFNSRHIALIQENLSRSRRKGPKICKIVRPLKTARHFKLMRKFHNLNKLKKSVSNEAIYWTCLAHKIQCNSIAAHGDCKTEQLLTIDCQFNLYGVESSSPITKTKLVEGSPISPDFNEIYSLDCIDYHGVIPIQIYAVSKLMICQIYDFFLLNSIDFYQKRFDFPKSERDFKYNSKRNIKNSNCSIVNISLSFIDEKFGESTTGKNDYQDISDSKEQEDSKNFSLFSNRAIENKNNHQYSPNATPENWTKNPIVALEKILWDSVIPRSWIFLFQFSDFFLECCITAIIVNDLLKENCLPAGEKPKEIKGILKEIKKPKIPQNRCLKRIMRKICNSLIYESVIQTTKLKHIPRNAVKSSQKSSATRNSISKARPHRKRSININNSEVKTKSTVLKDILIQSKNQIQKSMINENLNKSLRVHNRHKRFLTPHDFRFSLQPIAIKDRNQVILRKTKPRLERIVIKAKGNKNNKKSGDLSDIRRIIKCSRNSPCYKGNLITTMKFNRHSDLDLAQYI